MSDTPANSWQRVSELFEQALAHAPEGRSGFLKSACAGDPDLLREVESLLAEHAADAGFLESPAVAVVAKRFSEDGSVELHAGQRVGLYQIESPLGRGGMGEVYVARDKLGRRIALKLLTLRFPGDRGGIARFQQEARALLALNHPHIVTIHDIDQADGTYYIASELVEGETLRERLDVGDLSLHEILEIVMQVATALSAAHEKGIVHRDIKPENIMIRRDGFVKVLDFGIAKLSDTHATGESEAPTLKQLQTAEGTVIGTAPYMSPEQARGLKIDARTDMWSLGVVLYEVVAGRRPFSGETNADVVNAILEKTPAPLTRYTAEVPEALQLIVSRALRKDQAARYQTATELFSDLKELRTSIEIAKASGEVVGQVRRPPTEPSNDPPRTVATRASSVEYLTTEIRRHKLGFVIASLLLLSAIAVIGVYLKTRKPNPAAPAEIQSLAVLPFKNESGNADLEYLTDGVSEALINSLSQLPGVKVIARSSAFTYKGKEVNPQEVAKTLGVEAILTGRVVQRGENLVISVELVEADDRRQLWGERYDRKAGDLQAVQGEIARTISEKLRVKLTGAQEQQLTKHATENPEAYQLFLIGEFYLRKTGKENTRKALDYYNQAIALDPDFAEAYAGVAETYNIFAGAGTLDPKEANARAKAAAEKALALDEMVARAHVWLGLIELDEWNWFGAEKEFKRALELNPNGAGPHALYTFYLTAMGQHNEALVEIKRAEELDPLQVRPKFREGTILYNARRYDEAIKQLQFTLELQPGFSPAHFLLGTSYAMKGMYAEAINEYQKETVNQGETTEVQAYLGYAYAMSGQREQAVAILNKLKTTKDYVSPAELAILYAGLGDKDGAFRSLETAYVAHDLQMQYLKVDPHYDSLRSDPRFQDLLRRVGLPS
jgi:eukaryotic-like serine/threonine-protein kinase